MVPHCSAPVRLNHLARCTPLKAPASASRSRGREESFEALFHDLSRYLPTLHSSLGICNIYTTSPASPSPTRTSRGRCPARASCPRCLAAAAAANTGDCPPPASPGPLHLPSLVTPAPATPPQPCPCPAMIPVLLQPPPPVTPPSECHCQDHKMPSPRAPATSCRPPPRCWRWPRCSRSAAATSRPSRWRTCGSSARPATWSCSTSSSSAPSRSRPR